MRYVHIAVIVLLTILVLAFKLQNLQLVTVEFFAFSVTMPVTLLIVPRPPAGMLLGGSFCGTWIKRSYRGGFPAK